MLPGCRRREERPEGGEREAAGEELRRATGGEEEGPPLRCAPRPHRARAPRAHLLPRPSRRPARPAPGSPAPAAHAYCRRAPPPRPASARQPRSTAADPACVLWARPRNTDPELPHCWAPLLGSSPDASCRVTPFCEF
ncbi:uncharacterized protein LOC110560069 [Meriones unguiculatus]|uniref:uncharacterized protein LOC110560069 n=1 Tax=Meriones unguiculatus TaxID=10047 RepID=UPI000B4FB180|nr:uncharacterized protein LOC110560069 [Meriones unguiculatus]